jgi:hypothetical protein
MRREALVASALMPAGLDVRERRGELVAADG